MKRAVAPESMLGQRVDERGRPQPRADPIQVTRIQEAQRPDVPVSAPTPDKPFWTSQEQLAYRASQREYDAVSEYNRAVQQAQKTGDVTTLIKTLRWNREYLEGKINVDKTLDDLIKYQRYPTVLKQEQAYQEQVKRIFTPPVQETRQVVPVIAAPAEKEPGWGVLRDPRMTYVETPAARAPVQTVQQKLIGTFFDRATRILPLSPIGMFGMAAKVDTTEPERIIRTPIEQARVWSPVKSVGMGLVDVPFGVIGLPKAIREGTIQAVAEPRGIPSQIVGVGTGMAEAAKEDPVRFGTGIIAGLAIPVAPKFFRSVPRATGPVAASKVSWGTVKTAPPPVTTTAPRIFREPTPVFRATPSSRPSGLTIAQEVAERGVTRPGFRGVSIDRKLTHKVPERFGQVGIRPTMDTVIDLSKVTPPRHALDITGVRVGMAKETLLARGLSPRELGGYTPGDPLFSPYVPRATDIGVYARLRRTPQLPEGTGIQYGVTQRVFEQGVPAETMVFDTPHILETTRGLRVGAAKETLYTYGMSPKEIRGYTPGDPLISLYTPPATDIGAYARLRRTPQLPEGTGTRYGVTERVFEQPPRFFETTHALDTYWVKIQTGASKPVFSGMAELSPVETSAVFRQTRTPPAFQLTAAPEGAVPVISRGVTLTTKPRPSPADPTLATPRRGWVAPVEEVARVSRTTQILETPTPMAIETVRRPVAAATVTRPPAPEAGQKLGFGMHIPEQPASIGFAAPSAFTITTPVQQVMQAPARATQVIYRPTAPPRQMTFGLPVVATKPDTSVFSIVAPGQAQIVSPGVLSITRPDTRVTTTTMQRSILSVPEATPPDRRRLGLPVWMPPPPRPQPTPAKTTKPTTPRTPTGWKLPGVPSVFTPPRKPRVFPLPDIDADKKKKKRVSRRRTREFTFLEFVPVGMLR